MLEAPYLETDRLTLRGLGPDDAEALVSVYATPEATRYIEITPFELPEEAAALIDLWIDRQRAGTGLRWGLFLRGCGTLAGTCGLSSINLVDRGAEIGYDLAPAHWGRGLVPEAVRAVLRHAFLTLKLNRVQAFVVPEGAQSMRVLEKLGFQRDGVLREAGHWKGRYWDKVCFSLLRREWSEELASPALRDAPGDRTLQPATPL